jgi:hypothetical protein
MTHDVGYYEQRIRDLLQELHGLEARKTRDASTGNPFIYEADEDIKRLRKELRQWEVKLQNLNREM